ncbi:MAG: hypothetical protein IPM58_14630 [Nitrospira sp.]|nr:hypothetical protein [Nitrospira sp.]
MFDSGPADEIDTIQFGSTVAVDDVDVYRNGFNLELVIRGTADELTLVSFFGLAGYEQKQVRFADGTLWDSAELSARAVVGATITGTFESETMVGTDGHDLLIGSAGNDVVQGGDGKDTLYGDTTFQSLFGPQVIGDDTLLGGAGDDTLFDFRGNNLFDGGAGNDTLVLGTGVDTVLFGRGSGLDRVSLDGGRNDIDVIHMAADIAPTDVVLSWRSSSVADILISDSGDRLTVQLSTDSFAVGPETTQARVRFADGTERSLEWSSLNVGVPAARRVMMCSVLCSLPLWPGLVGMILIFSAVRVSLEPMGSLKQKVTGSTPFKVFSTMCWIRTWKISFSRRTAVLHKGLVTS